MTPKPRPLILHPHEVRAAIAGTLGEIWRPVFDHHARLLDGARTCFSAEGYDAVSGSRIVTVPWTRESIAAYMKCPFGPVGTELAGKETWAGGITQSPDSVDYRADGFDYGRDEDGRSLIRWRSAATMPLWASRIRLETTGVEVRRVQSITEEEARGTGVNWQDGAPNEFGLNTQLVVVANEEFRYVWDLRYSKRGLAWAGNPWSWRVVVRRVKA